ncbi:MAG: lipoate--protein ligase [Lachnospiraceae bacterium]
MITSLRHFCSDVNDPFQNIATEEYLTFHTGEQECILFLWQNSNTVVIGKNQNAYKECKVSKLEESGGHLARRLSGGGAVYHDLGNLNFTFCVRKSEYNLDRQFGVILRAVNSFGLNAERTGRNDIAIDGKKFSGNAFFSSGDYAYSHGTIMINVNSAKLSDFLTVSEAKLKSKGVSSVKSRVVNLAQLNPDITIEAMKKALITAFEEEYGLPSTLWKPQKEEWDAIEEGRQRFASEEWRFGTSPSMSNEFLHRFDWGEVQIFLQVEAGRIKDVKVYTDALDAGMAEKIQTALMGRMYRLEDLKKASEEQTESKVSEAVCWIADSLE